MTTSVEALKSRLAHIRQELEDVSDALDSLDKAPALRFTQLPRAGNVDRLALLAVLDAAYAEMGVDLTEPVITAEELQALMLEGGIRPEDNMLSSGIIAAREE